MRTTTAGGSHEPVTRARAALALGCCALVAVSGCTSGEILLVVDLRTDYAPGLEVSSVQTDIELDTTGAPTRPRRASTPLTHGQDIASGVRIAEFEDIPSGTHTILVRLFDANGGQVATRRVRATVTSTTSIVAIVTRSCRGVVCPASGGAPEATECLDGRCVPPECTTPDACIEPACEVDGDCPSEGCAVGACASGACLLQPQDDLCPSGQLCHPDDGCVEVAVRDAGVDAGARDSGPPPDCTVSADCDDGVACTVDGCVDGVCQRLPDDASCDDGVACTADSCGPTGCSHAPNDGACDDGVGCTTDTCGPTGCASVPNDAACDDGIGCTADSCGPGGCVNAPNDAACNDGVGCTDDVCVAGTGCNNIRRHARCSDGNPCTDDTCTATGCRNPNNSAPCDDGVFCNGPDTCGGGSCSLHGGNPCNVGAGEICSE